MNLEATILKGISLSIFYQSFCNISQIDSLVALEWYFKVCLFPICFAVVVVVKLKFADLKEFIIIIYSEKNFQQRMDMLRKASATPLVLVGKCLKPWTPMYHVQCTPWSKKKSRNLNVLCVNTHLTKIKICACFQVPTNQHYTCNENSKSFLFSIFPFCESFHIHLTVLDLIWTWYGWWYAK